MVVTLIKYLASALAGFVLCYALFINNSAPNQTIPATEILEPLSEAVSVIPTDSSQATTPLTVNQSLNSDDKIAALSQTISEQQNRIKALTQQIEQLNSNKLSKVTPDESLETISMQDFEKQMQSQFLNRFKGVAIEISERELKPIKATFENGQAKGQWNAEYEANIIEHIQQADPNGLHFVDELTCNRRYCRLQVNSSDPKNWQKLYSSLTKQSWYKSMTLSEKSEDNNQITYYITEPAPFGE